MKDELKKFLRNFLSCDENTLEEIIKLLDFRTYEKHKILVAQGAYTDRCYFVLQGLLRQYHVDEDGNEVTAQFYTQGMSALHDIKEEAFNQLETLEDTVVVVGDKASEERMYKAFSQVQSANMAIMAEQLNQIHRDFTLFKKASPEERLRMLLEDKRDLVNRVPQRMLASYLGMTPESFSRIKKRMQ
ncbi:MAG: Crp/Fnr family transcriptional regulator [Clostridia bacterium]|nr:Crp/Fnr family transcriptional regulator [Clostridia bacterium]